eukprot:3109184-Pyramimonas_sp.AAC.1
MTAPRALLHIPEGACEALAMLFNKCEDLLVWPSERIWTDLKGLAKPEGGTGLIALINTSCRIWGKIRQSVTSDWQVAHGCLEIWGTRRGCSSSDSAFAHDLCSEVATL